jgi:propanol-preferring alcohol dehydrogenase
MKAMQLEKIGSLAANAEPLRLVELPEPQPAAGEVLILVQACGVCHTELDEIEGRTPPPVLPMILGHQVVGTVVARGSGVSSLAIGDRIGVAWIYSACGDCEYCRSGRENLCSQFQATGRDRPGGYAEYMTAPASFVHRLPAALDDLQAAPLLCAGAIGYRSLRLTNLANGQPIGLTGFGASAHLILKMIRHRYPDSEVFVFARSEKERQFALELGAAWAGETAERAPRLLAAIIDTTPAWTPVAAALHNLAPGGRLVINAIRKESADRQVLAEIDYPRQLWLEKEIKSVANVTRQDVAEALNLAAELQLQPRVQAYDLRQANQALIDLKTKPVAGAKVLVVRA